MYQDLAFGITMHKIYNTVNINFFYPSIWQKKKGGGKKHLYHTTLDFIFWRKL